jgi:hypothetical protein
MGRKRPRWSKRQESRRKTMSEDKLVVFKRRELAGSRLRCLMMTSGSRKQVAERLSELAKPFGTVDEKRHHWMPGGFLSKSEAQLGRTAEFLTPTQREALLRWWLVRRKGAQTPNWDIVSTCTVNDDDHGLLLVEAKAHIRELGEDDRCKAANADNRKNIGSRLKEVSAELNKHLPGWRLASQPHYQLSNRFAWSWNLASMGIPVILVYLGFLNVDEMPNPFKSADDWRKAVLEYAKNIVPEKAWKGEPIPTSGVPFRALIRAVDVKFEVSKPD